MPLYGDLEAVKRMLRPTDDSAFGDDEDNRLLEIQQAVSSALEFRLRRSFGVAVSDTAKTVYAGPYGTLLLPVPARSIASVTWNPQWLSGAWSGGTVYGSDYWVGYPADSRTGEIFGLRLVSGGAWGWNDRFGNPAVPVRITGDFVDTDDDAQVPEEITYAANRVIAETFKTQNAGPGGTTGPDGNTIRPHDPWKEPLVVSAIEKHRSANRLVAF